MIQTIRNIYLTIDEFRQIELVKNLVDGVYMTFGALAIHNLTYEHIIKKKRVRKHKVIVPKKQHYFRMFAVMRNVSLIFAAIISRPALTIWKWSIKQILNESQLKTYFGTDSIFTEKGLYSWISFSSFVLGLPSTIRFIYNCSYWLSRTITTTSGPINNKDKKSSHTKELNAFVTVKTIANTAYMTGKFFI